MIVPDDVKPGDMVELTKGEATALIEGAEKIVATALIFSRGACPTELQCDQLAANMVIAALCIIGRACDGTLDDIIAALKSKYDALPPEVARESVQRCDAMQRQASYLRDAILRAQMPTPKGNA